MATREMVISSARIQSAPVSSAAGSYTQPLAILTTLFFMWGFITCLNDILVPHLKSISDLQLYVRDAGPVCFLLGLLPLLYCRGQRSLTGSDIRRRWSSA